MTTITEDERAQLRSDCSQYAHVPSSTDYKITRLLDALQEAEVERDILVDTLADGPNDCPYLTFWLDEKEPNLPDWCICSDTEEGGFDCAEDDYKECWKRWAKEQAAAEFAIK
jgi:hypothetical protein